MNPATLCSRLSLLAALAFTSVTVLTSAATGNPWYDAFKTYDDTKGLTYTTSTDASILAWQESFIQRAYLNLYAATGHQDWLDKFVVHANAVTDPAIFTDVDGDGYVDWLTHRYSPDLTTRQVNNTDLVTGTFEYPDATDPTLPHAWLRYGSTAATAARTNAAGEFVPGNACSTVTWGFELITANGTTQRLYQIFPAYEPSRKYQLTLSARRGGSVNGRAFVYNRTTNSVLVSITLDSDSWKSYTASFDTPADPTNQLEIWLAHLATTPADQSVFFDNVRIAAYHSYHVLDGMIGIPLANFVRLVRQNPVTLSAFVADADRYQTFLETEVIAKWQDSAGYYGNTWVNASATEGYYREPANHDTFATPVVLDPLPYNQYFVLLELQHILHTVTPTSAYLDKVERGARYFANRLTQTSNPAAYTWYYAGFPGSKIEDASHVNVDMEFITELHRFAHVFTDADMGLFTGTLTNKLWNQLEGADAKLHNLVTGQPGTYCGGDWQFSTLMYGWVPYAQFDSRAWQIAAWQYKDRVIADHTSAATLSQILRWDPVKLVNQGFELPAPNDPTLPARWTRSLSDANTAYRDSANKTSGDWGLTVKTNNYSYQRLVQPWEGYENGVQYTVTFDAKTDTSGAQGRVLVYNITNSAIIAAYNFSNTTWQTHTFTFTSPTNDDQVNLQLGHLYHNVVDGYTHYDNVVIKRSGDTW